MNKHGISFYQFYSILNKKTKNGFVIKFKDESLLMKILSKILFFNKDFLTKYTTTIGKTIYFPNRAYVEDSENDDCLIILAHEFVHVRDGERLGLLFSLIYLFPQILTLLFLAVAPISIYGLFLLLFLLPLPEYGRMLLELRAYSSNIYSLYRILKERGDDLKGISVKEVVVGGFIDKQFSSFSYYLMWPFGIKKYLAFIIDAVNSGEFEKTNDIYKDLSEAYDELFRC